MRAIITIVAERVVTADSATMVVHGSAPALAQDRGRLNVVGAVGLGVCPDTLDANELGS